MATIRVRDRGRLCALSIALAMMACNGSDLASPSAGNLREAAAPGSAAVAALTLTGHIAFVSNRAGNDEIYVMKADGSGVTRLTKNAANDEQPAWSPDGKKIAFVSNRAGNGEIYSMYADGSSVTRLTNNAGLDRDPVWSPAGTKVAFASNRSGRFEIYVMNANGSGVKRLTTNLPFQGCGGTSIGQEILPTWSPGGGKIAFRHKATCFSTSIDIMNADGTGVTKLTDAKFALRLGWGRTGKIVFDGRVWPGEGLSDGEIAVVTVSGATVTRLTNNSANDVYPSWSPDASKIAFASNRNGNYEIYAMNANGSGVSRLTSNSALDVWPAWGP
jgi:Tol biopolymer transport system component